MPHIPVTRRNPSRKLLGRLLGIFLVVEDDTRIGGATRTPHQPLTSSLTWLAELVPAIGAMLFDKIQVTDSPDIFQATVNGNFAAPTTSEVMAVSGDDDITALETLGGIEKKLHGLRFLGSRYSQGHLRPANPMAWYK